MVRFIQVLTIHLPTGRGCDFQVSDSMSHPQCSGGGAITCFLKNLQNQFFEWNPYSTWSDVFEWGIKMTLLIHLMIVATQTMISACVICRDGHVSKMALSTLALSVTKLTLTWIIGTGVIVGHITSSWMCNLVFCVLYLWRYSTFGVFRLKYQHDMAMGGIQD